MPNEQTKSKAERRPDRPESVFYRYLHCNSDPHTVRTERVLQRLQQPVKLRLLLYPQNFTLDNYKEVLFGENITTWFQNTIFLAVVTVILSLTAAVPAAYCFSRRRFPGRKTILKCLVLLNSFPAILSMFAIYRLPGNAHPVYAGFHGTGCQ